MNIDQAIDQLIDREGGLIEDGGPDTASKYGINQHTLQLWMGRGVSIDDIRNLDKRTAREIYYSWWLIKPGFSQLPMLIQPVMLDTAVCAKLGQKRAIKMLQDALICHGFDCAPEDGRIGDLTIAAAFAAAERLGNTLIKILINRRIIAYESIVRNDETQRQFLARWVARAESFLPA